MSEMLHDPHVSPTDIIFYRDRFPKSNLFRIFSEKWSRIIEWFQLIFIDDGLCDIVMQCVILFDEFEVNHRSIKILMIETTNNINMISRYPHWVMTSDIPFVKYNLFISYHIEYHGYHIRVELSIIDKLHQITRSWFENNWLRDRRWSFFVGQVVSNESVKSCKSTFQFGMIHDDWQRKISLHMCSEWKNLIRSVYRQWKR